MKNYLIISKMLFVLTALYFVVGTNNAFSMGPPDYLPDGPHPRIWLTAAKLAQLQTKAQLDATGASLGGTVAPEWKAFINLVAPYKTSGTYYNMAAWHFALAYIITKDTAYRDRALALADAVIIDMVDERYDSGLYGYKSMMDVALTFDWLYKELGDTRKANYINYMTSFLNEWWNPAAPYYNSWAKEDPNNNYYWHHMMATAIATVVLYGESIPTMSLVTNKVTYTTPISFWNAKMLQASIQLSTEGKGGGWHEGIPYGQSAMEPMAMAWLAYKTATGKDYFNDLSFAKEAVNYLLQAIQPDDYNYFPSGDLTRDPKGGLNQYYRSVMLLMAEGLEGASESEYAQYWTENYYTTLTQNDLIPLNFIFRKSDRTSIDHKAALPLGYYAPGYGFVSWRKSWSDSASPAISFISSDQIESHQHKDQNSFYIFYNGWQVSDSNLYESSGINQKANLTNTYIINGHGQYIDTSVSPRAGNVIYQDIQNNYFYVKGDAKNAYAVTSDGRDRSYGSLLLNYYLRSILSNGYFTLVYDRVSPKDPTYVTDYYLHFAGQPVVSGITASATNGTGMMFHTTLFPEVNIVAGSDSTWVTGSTGGYLKVTPKTQLSDNYIINAIEVAPNGTINKTPVSLIDGVNFRGAIFNNSTKNQIMLFSSTSTEMSNGSYNVSTTAPSSHYISDLPVNAQINIIIDGSLYVSKNSSSSGVITFDYPSVGLHNFAISLVTRLPTPPATPTGLKKISVSP